MTLASESLVKPMLWWCLQCFLFLLALHSHILRIWSPARPYSQNVCHILRIFATFSECGLQQGHILRIFATISEYGFAMRVTPLKYLYKTFPIAKCLPIAKTFHSKNFSIPKTSPYLELPHSHNFAIANSLPISKTFPFQ